MEFSGFTLMMTDDCNFNCSYCYQIKEQKYLDVTTAIKAIDFFFPFFVEDCFVSFYGGEPLLAFDQIREIVGYIQDKNQKKRIRYSINTNGSLINDEVLQFLNENKFTLMLSFDGYAQEDFRQKGSFTPLVSCLEKILGCSDISLATNSVFTPESVGYLSRSTRFIVELGVPSAMLSFSNLQPWDTSALFQLKKEMGSVREFILSFYRKTGTMPLTNFRKTTNNRVFSCYAGKDRMALATDGLLWGCCHFPDCYRRKGKPKEYLKYCFGSLNSFIENHETVYPEIIANYSNLNMGYFFTSKTFCMLCEDMEECVVCPMDAAMASPTTGKIPDWTCKIRKILRQEKVFFYEE